MTESGSIQQPGIIFPLQWGREAGRGVRHARRGPYHWAMRRGSAVFGALLAVGSAGVLLGLASCAPPAISGGFDSPHPAARIYATRRAASERRPDELRSAIPGLIRNLESDDPAVRLLSAEALDELTGESFGYRHFDPEWLRAPAVRRWRDAWTRGEITLRDGTPIGPDTLESTSLSERTELER